MQVDQLKRREFITLLGGAAATWPFAARAQRAAVPVVGYLQSGAPGPSASYLAALRQGLNETGYVEGQNLTIEYRWAEGNYDRLPALAADLVRGKVDVIATGGGPPAALAAKDATSTIPIVFVMAIRRYEKAMINYGFVAVRRSAWVGRIVLSDNRLLRGAFKASLRVATSIPLLKRRIMRPPL